MKRAIGFLIVLAVLAAPAIAQKVTIDYAKDYDFDQVKSFAFVETPDTNTGNDLVDNRIKGAIVRELREGGLEQVQPDAGPDLYITYHVASEERRVWNTTDYGYGGWGPGWGPWPGYGYRGRYGVGFGGSTTTETTYTDGTLVIDAYEPADKQLVWRGTGTVTVKANPEKRAKQVDNILNKLGKRWDKILKEQGK